MKDLRIYVHIPFCESKCVYCDFPSFVLDDNNAKNMYFQKLLADIYDTQKKDYVDIKKLRKESVVKSIYIGGGTPSCVPPEKIGQILLAIKNLYNVDSEAEITIECNPCSATLTKLQTYYSLGINRISFGVQSLNDETLKFLGRRHNSQQAIKAIKNAIKVGFEDISADLIIGVNNNLQQLIEDANTLIDLGVTHISAYMLQIEEGTPLAQMVNENSNLLPDDETVTKMYQALTCALAENNFIRYEISNFAPFSYESKHNMGYWKGDNYIGFGLGAHSYVEGVRFWQPKTLQEYFLAKPEEISYEILTNKQKIEEKIMLGLRCINGVSIKELAELGYDIKSNPNYAKLCGEEQDKPLYEYQGYIYLKSVFYTLADYAILNLLPEN